MRRRTTHDTRSSSSSERGVFMISVAAELAEMHPQTLRMYETRGLIEPKRSPKGTRLYSQADVERLRRIQEMTTELGLNLAGVERVLELEEQLERATRRLEALERRSAEMRAEMEAEIERVRKSFKAELVPYKGTDRPHPRRRRRARACARSASSATVARLRRPRCAGGAARRLQHHRGEADPGGATARGRPRARGAPCGGRASVRPRPDVVQTDVRRTSAPRWSNVGPALPDAATTDVRRRPALRDRSPAPSAASPR